MCTCASHSSSSSDAYAFLANFDQFPTEPFPDGTDTEPVDAFASVQVASAPTSPTLAVDVDPFQTVDPFASQADVDPAVAANDWFQPSQSTLTSADPFVSQTEPPQETPPAAIEAVVSPKTKRAAPKANGNPAGWIRRSSPEASSTSFYLAASKAPAAVDPWGTPAASADTHGNDWAQFKSTEASSPFGASTEWPQPEPVVDEPVSGERSRLR